MNVTTGEIIRLPADHVLPDGFVPVSERVAKAVEIGMEHLNRAERRARHKRERQNRKRGRR